LNTCRKCGFTSSDETDFEKRFTPRGEAYYECAYGVGHLRGVAFRQSLIGAAIINLPLMVAYTALMFGMQWMEAQFGFVGARAEAAVWIMRFWAVLIGAGLPALVLWMGFVPVVAAIFNCLLAWVLFF